MSPALLAISRCLCGNLYYAAAVKSMLTSAENFFFLLLPPALAGALSAALLYFMARRVFGPPAALLASLMLALTPIAAMANRNNTMHSVLVSTLLLAAWAVSRRRCGSCRCGKAGRTDGCHRAGPVGQTDYSIAPPRLSGALF